MILQELVEKKLCQPPRWLPGNCVYLTIMGSVAYGVSGDTSDQDIYGICIPQREELFPHLRGEILGFGKPLPRFEQWQKHHIHDPSAGGGKGRVYDFTIYNIVKYFNLTMECNPNMIDSLFTPANCVLHCTQVGNMIRENRRLFLHKGAINSFKGYSYSQLHKMSTKSHELEIIYEFEQMHHIAKKTTLNEVENEIQMRQTTSSPGPVLGHLTDEELNQYLALYRQGMEKSIRFEMCKIHGFDVKFAYHLIRLLDECSQILTHGDIDIQRNREELKAIRRGEWTEKYLREVFADRERRLEAEAEKSTLRARPDVPAIKQLLLNCLEHHYGSLEKCIVNTDEAVQALRDIHNVLGRVQSLID